MATRFAVGGAWLASRIDVMRVSSTVVALGLAIGLGLAACSPATAPAAAPAATTMDAATGENPIADPRVRAFHEQLVDNGEDLQSDFGSALLSLGMNPRDLQQDDPQHAYNTVLEKVRVVADAAERREMMLTFFGTADLP